MDPPTVAEGVADLEIPLSEDATKIEVPAELLSKLLSSVDQLRTRVKQLEEKNTNLQADIARLKRHNSGEILKPASKVQGTFHCFPRLPKELRYMVFENAFRIPYVHTVKDRKLGKSCLNYLMASCKEARVVGKKLKLDFHLSGRASRQYMNIKLDTIWAPEGEYLSTRKADIFCGQCDGVWFGSLNSRSGGYCQHNLLLGRVILQEGSWKYAEDSLEEFGFEVRIYHPRELYLVVGNVPSTDMSNQSFKVPAAEPWKKVSNLFDQMRQDREEGLHDRYFDWDAACKDLAEKLTDLKEDSIEKSKAYGLGQLGIQILPYHVSDLSTDHGLSLEELEHGADGGFYRCWTTWQLPTVKYMEVFTVDEE